MYVPSLLAAIGGVIEDHLIAIGFLNAPGELADPGAAEAQVVMLVGGGPEGRSQDFANNETQDLAKKSPFRQCPKCAQASLIHQEGCDTCTSCGYSKCA